MTTIKCNECKCLIEKKDAQEVKTKRFVEEIKTNLEYYCKRCKKPYDRAFYGIYEHFFYKKVEVEVDEKGNNLEVKRLENELERYKKGNNLEVKRLEDELEGYKKGNDKMYISNILYLISISILIATIIYIS